MRYCVVNLVSGITVYRTNTVDDAIRHLHYNYADHPEDYGVWDDEMHRWIIGAETRED